MNAKDKKYFDTLKKQHAKATEGMTEQEIYAYNRKQLGINENDWQALVKEHNAKIDARNTENK